MARVWERWVVGRARRRLRSARYWYSIGDLDEAARAGRHALDLALADHRDAVPRLLLADIVLNLARTEQDRDDYVAGHAGLEYALNLLESITGGGNSAATADRDRLLAWTLVGLGESHRRAGRYQQAIETLDRAVQFAETIAADQPRALCAALTERGITAKELGEYDLAARRYARVQAIHRDAGATHADAAALEHNLSGLEYARGCHPQAEFHARRALDLRQLSRSTADVEIAADLAVLAAAVAAQHRHDEAREMFEQALFICRAARPPRRYEIGVHLHGLADIEHSAGRADQAERRYREALELKQELLGVEHPEVGLVIGNLGTLLHEQSREKEAVDCFRRALAIARQAFGPDHPRAASFRDKLARASAITRLD